MGIEIKRQWDRGAQLHLLACNPKDLVEELNRYRLQSEQLERVYELHRRLGEKPDLASMMEAFSAWLKSYFPHELVAYRHGGRRRSYISCSCHGPQRQSLVDAASQLLTAESVASTLGHLDLLDMRYRFLLLNPEPAAERLLLIFDQQSDVDGYEAMVTLVARELRGPLDRVLAYEDLYDQARRDALTGLVNRRVLDERLEQEVANAVRYGHPLCLAYLDLDHFKAVNDVLGHAEGDVALRQVSLALSGMIRDSDCLARVGGDEFAMILPHTDLERGRKFMERLCTTVRSLNIQAPGHPVLGVSIGISQWHSGLAMDHWLEVTDAALYKAKAGGRCRVCTAEGEE
ncbi:diguanylate cyclase [Magnetococcus marinus MC-1]|uniref:diguanylate cyclase n=1 Tax=Magnetococcus marinus (strain ATCC BAA-1437 / JCM 17883 / MC-1) TaxID=156889 RepID=A0LCM0_MAGMM|nr:GGDEF domain-containing protein [Magnetococcus marinus]ABK45713.1 diguanylate cyclase [Magnetococcus marinus MC-1]